VANISLILIFLSAIFLAYANGTNDNFKGVATLYGSKTASYSKALFWTTIMTALGSIIALYFASELIIVFKGKGLVPDSIMQMESFPLAVGIGAAIITGVGLIRLSRKTKNFPIMYFKNLSICSPYPVN